MSQIFQVPSLDTVAILKKKKQFVLRGFTTGYKQRKQEIGIKNITVETMKQLVITTDCSHNKS